VSELARRLEAALAATADALERGDHAAAAEAARLAAASCADLRATGERLPQASLARASALQDRCTATAVQRRAGLVRELDAAARSRRATDAYGR